MNFALCLVLLSLVSGLIILSDLLYFSKKRKAATKQGKLIENAYSFFPVFITVLILRSFLVEPFRIPSGSLEPTLHVGDFLAVNKFIYGIRLPVIEKKILRISTPKNGDIVVFRWPPEPAYDYIKRVIGIPGDHIKYHNKKLWINDKPMLQSFVGYTTDESSGKAVAEYTENLMGVKHKIYIKPDTKDTDFDVVVPKGQYFVMGDNRDDSADSRFWGFVQDKYLRGKAWLIWMSWDSQKDTIRWKRLGSFIR